MAELKTQLTKASVKAFIATVTPEKKRKDSEQLLKIFKEVTGMQPKMWGTSIIGYGMYHYESERSNQKGDWPLTGFSPRKQNLTLYVMPAYASVAKLIPKVGKCKTSKGCLYINTLEDIDVAVLKKIIAACVKEAKKIHGVK